MDTSEEYIKMADCPEIQGSWKPQIGDYILRRYTVFGEPLDSEIWPDKKTKEEINILHYHSDLPQYWHAVTPDGESRIVEFPDTTKMFKATHIFIPCQDQLQEMLEGPYISKFARMMYWATVIPTGDIKLIPFCKMMLEGKGFEESNIEKLPSTRCDAFTSPEQLWLAFVMKEKFNKSWNGSNWVKTL